MPDVLVTVSHHRTTSVPTTPSNDVHFLGKEGIRSADYRPDIEIVLEVLNRDVKWIPLRIKVGDDRFELPISVLIDHIPAITVAQEFGI